MNKEPSVWPMDVTDPTSRPSAFRPAGYLVVMLSDASEGERAQAALRADGIDDEDIKLYRADEILANHSEYMSRRTMAGKAVGSMTDDVEGRNIYLGYAHEGRSALWIRVSDDRVPRVLRALADHESLHIRYYGETSGQQDFHLAD